MINRNQIGGLKGIIIGALIALCIVGLGAYLNPFGNASSLSAVEKLNIAILLCSVPATFLAVAIGRLAKHRFFHQKILAEQAYQMIQVALHYCY